MKQPIDVMVRNADDKKRFCNPQRTDVRIISCSYYDCEFSDTCRLYEDRQNLQEAYQKFSKMLDNCRMAGGL